MASCGDVPTDMYRRIFWTDCGGIGLGPAAAQVGDKIGGLHEFIGEAYVHGLMDGKASEYCSNEPETFVII
ncbi:MAG: hypothetical protein M1840_001716 [Geoglossum simile]|nr:MAG: hypothetical protein M1840_001716 [Geoglossum simile]